MRLRITTGKFWLGWFGGFGHGDVGHPLSVVDNDASLGWLDPLISFVDASESTDGADDVHGGRSSDFINSFEDFFGGQANIFTPTNIQAGGSRVIVDGFVGGYSILGSNPAGLAPIEEVGFDGFALGMAADLAFAGVAIEIRGHEPRRTRSRDAGRYAWGGGFGGRRAFVTAMAGPQQCSRGGGEGARATACVRLAGDWCCDNG